MKNVVKNTTRISWFDLLCPYTCRGCGALGDVICECCKNYIIQSRETICPMCKKKLAVKDNDAVIVKCKDCQLKVAGVFVGGWREGALAELVKDFKYKSVRAAGRVLAEILDTAIPKVKELEEVTVVPLPTIGKHVRERGIDHTKLLARELARRREWEVKRVLGRKTDTVQVGASMKKRREQAAKTYEVVRRVDPERTYLLLDDIWTTGASVLAAVEAMRKAGARKIFVAVVATGREREQH